MSKVPQLRLFPTSMVGLGVINESRKVTIITRTKNRPILLARALSSVLSQTYTDWELIVVNDGGDESEVTSLLAQYERAFSDRLKVIHHLESKGMEAASNAGLRIATGDYLVVHDDDDSWKPDFLKATVDFLSRPTNSRFAAVATNCEVIQEQIFENSVVTTAKFPWGFWHDRVDIIDLARTNSFPPISLVIRMSAVELIGGFNDALPVLGDWEYNLRVFSVGDIGTIDEPLAYYHLRVNQDGTYGNTVTSGAKMHHDYNVLLRNSLVRLAILQDPSRLGILNLALTALDNLESKVAHQITESTSRVSNQVVDVLNQVIEQQSRQAAEVELLLLITKRLEDKSNTVDQALWPLKWVWRKVLPTLRFIARVRGRI
jgi:glycosyltransferase involved in cell wall biosynthesis